MKADFHDGGAKARSEFGDHIEFTAGDTADGSEANGNWVDRQAGGIFGQAMSAKLVLAYRATLAQGATLSVAANIQDATSDAGAGVDDFGPALTNTVVATGDTGGSTEEGTIELDFDLAGANRYVRSQITPTLSAADTDVLDMVATWIFFGADRNPISKSLVSDPR